MAFFMESLIRLVFPIPPLARLTKDLKEYFLIRNHNQTCNHFILSNNRFNADKDFVP